jgi:Abnormal spindle-like microcephaly-assoc'd, ASPM-SPD-2-Hydin
VSGSVTGLGCSFTPGVNGNVSASPRFVAPATKDFHLRPDSPAVNAGASASPLATLDMDGEARTIGAAPDLGADEFAGLVAANVAPSSLDHGAQKVGTVGPPLTTTLRNDGALPLRVSPVSSSSSEFTATTTCVTPAGIAPGATCAVSVTFRPTVKGPRSATVTVESNGVGSPHAISVSGIGTAPVIALDPAAIDFGDVRTHTIAKRTISVTNVGDAGSTGLAVAVEGTAMSATNGCAGTIAIGASCAIEVSFAPSARGAVTGKVTVTGDGYNLPIEAPLAGRGVAPVIQVSAATLSLGAVKVGSSTEAPLTISNVGELPLLLASITTSGEFSHASACGDAVAPGASCEVVVTFTPLDGGSRTGQLRIVHDADGSPTVIPLSGVGQDFSITAYPASLTVPSGSVVQMSALVQFEGGWADPVAVSCTGMPAPGRCLLDPAVVSPGGPGVVAVELHTTAATVAALAGAGGSVAAAGFLLLPGLSLAAGGRGARRRRRITVLAAAAAAMILAGACSSGGGGGPGGPQGLGALGAGTYGITIHAASAGVERTATVSLTVTPR